ncbi:helicase-exonuclease AddAB subunit AddA [Paenibacillus sp. IB182496]|uniref:ATP-dependent helicase/nuclease subunit A n=2 Tax=Paenibacillus sabuli TaxID=2772509 RepID=A0A927BRA5_9BACL|nr:helicase-exonuclease AddAB subunit AddA [Paenibacillus sabuli]
MQPNKQANQPARPAGSTWTEQQWEAIVAGGRDILVAAAAGSGKTAVLVERIIRKITSGADVDRLLVATFTKAAAAEMKERIRIALEKELAADPDSEHLRRQLALMTRASITTLHSFCVEVIRRYYPLIGLDPGFRIANETEAELLRLDVLEQLFEARYAELEAHPGFAELAERFGGEKDDEPLQRLVQRLYDFSRSHPWPEHWLRAAAATFHVADEIELGDTHWVRRLAGDAQGALAAAQTQLEQALELTRQPGGPDAYAPTLEAELAAVRKLALRMADAPWTTWQAAFAEVAFGRLKAVRAGEADQALQERTKRLRDNARTVVAQLQDELLGRSPAEFLAELRDNAPLMEELSELTIAFGEAYEREKRAKGLLDFGDLEHYCLRILRGADSEPGRTVPSSAALDYREQFDEVLLDEYQDTNMVQEALVELIARPGNGNRFMVGDVKQSIYRFRLAEPGLFLDKYKRYGAADSDGQRIDLARNFRSRREVVDGVNDVFRLIMRERVAELDYDRSAELIHGAAYPARADGAADPRLAVELTLLDRADAPAAEPEERSDAEPGEDGEGQPSGDAGDLQAAQLEARFIAARIRAMRGDGAERERMRVYDGRRGGERPLQWRDIVILLRATQQWAPLLIEELQAAGIPAYAELNTGYFDATEVEIMIALLRVIDNPHQDIPLAGTLRSPLFGLGADELALLRVHAPPGASYYEAVAAAADDAGLPQALTDKVRRFLRQLARWRAEARQGALSELLWAIYHESGYYDLVGGLPGGLQRQANLRALHDRARQYEATSFRGLFRFLRFIDRMRENGSDLGTARALGEQEDVVRILSIHKSKGLEYPVVFVAGLGKRFNMQDVNGAFLMHKQLGYGPRQVDLQLRIAYPTLPQLAIRRAMKTEQLAEEMRVLYVALTRAKEKLVLVGTAADAAKLLENKRAEAETEPSDYTLSQARTYLDWLLPVALRGGAAAQPTPAEDDAASAAQWRLGIAQASWYAAEAAVAAAPDPLEEAVREQRLEAVSALHRIPDLAASAHTREVVARLGWAYPHAAATEIPAKTSATELKRLYSEQELEDAAQLEDVRRPPRSAAAPSSSQLRLRRPRFMEEAALTAAERGTVSHLVMQHVPLGAAVVDAAVLRRTVERMRERQLLTAAQAEAVDAAAVEAFFQTPLGGRLQRAPRVRREVPFSCLLPAARVHRAAAEAQIGAEPVMIQGVVDCLFEEADGTLVLLDYKTDRVPDRDWTRAAERHRFQLELYAEAAAGILGRRIDECHVFFFDGAHTVRLC